MLEWERPARVLAVVDGESIGSSSSPSAASIFSKFSSRLGSESGMIVAGFGGDRRRYVEGTACSTNWLGLSPVVRTVRKVEVVVVATVDTTTLFCLAACCALARAAISSSWSATGVSGCMWPGWYRLMCFERSPLYRNLFKQVLKRHRNGFSPVCFLLWESSFDCVKNPFPQLSQNSL